MWKITLVQFGVVFFLSRSDSFRHPNQSILLVGDGRVYSGEPIRSRQIDDVGEHVVVPPLQFRRSFRHFLRAFSHFILRHRVFSAQIFNDLKIEIYFSQS